MNFKILIWFFASFSYVMLQCKAFKKSNKVNIFLGYLRDWFTRKLSIYDQPSDPKIKLTRKELT